MLAILAKALIVTGLTLDIVGVCLLAYDALYGAGRHFWLSNLDKYLQDAARQRDVELAIWERMKSRGSSEGYISRLNTETEQKYKASQDRIESRIRDWRDNYPKKVSILAFRGLMLAAFGFLLQIVGVLLS